MYCEGLQYFVPLIGAETNSVKKQQLRERANLYLKRAEEIKQTNKTEENVKPSPVSLSNHQQTAGSSKALNTALVPSALYSQLCNIIYL